MGCAVFFCLRVITQKRPSVILSLLVSVDQGPAAALLLTLQLDGVTSDCVLPSLALNGCLIPHKALTFTTVKQPLKTLSYS